MLWLYETEDSYVELIWFRLASCCCCLWRPNARRRVRTCRLTTASMRTYNEPRKNPPQKAWNDSKDTKGSGPNWLLP